MNYGVWLYIAIACAFTLAFAYANRVDRNSMALSQAQIYIYSMLLGFSWPFIIMLLWLGNPDD